jgi:hypothetical protein
MAEHPLPDYSHLTLIDLKHDVSHQFPMVTWIIYRFKILIKRARIRLNSASVRISGCSATRISTCIGDCKQTAKKIFNALRAGRSHGAGISGCRSRKLAWRRHKPLQHAKHSRDLLQQSVYANFHSIGAIADLMFVSIILEMAHRASN